MTSDGSSFYLSS